MYNRHTVSLRLHTSYQIQLCVQLIHVGSAECGFSFFIHSFSNQSLNNEVYRLLRERHKINTSQNRVHSNMLRRIFQVAREINLVN